MKNIAIGITFILLGIYAIRSAYKYPDSQLHSNKFRGYLAGSACVIFGIVVLINFRQNLFSH